jgi:(5-formylfuran-3-yl)methyl phosphate synthase
MPDRPGLLISVRSVAEAAAALEGGADLIDVKEPSRGSLGRSDNDTMRAVVRFVAGRRPVSAALGEVLEGSSTPAVDGLHFIKRGLAGCSGRFDWRSHLTDELQRPTPPQTVIVAYADWEQTGAPPLHEVTEFAAQWPGAAFLLDTFTKTGNSPNGTRPSLLSRISIGDVTRLCAALHRAGVRVALAGSLDADSIAALRSAKPDWFAVRGAACEQGHRDALVCSDRVRALRSLLHQPMP